MPSTNCDLDIFLLSSLAIPNLKKKNSLHISYYQENNAFR